MRRGVRYSSGADSSSSEYRASSTSLIDIWLTGFALKDLLLCWYSKDRLDDTGVFRDSVAISACLWCSPEPMGHSVTGPTPSMEDHEAGLCFHGSSVDKHVGWVIGFVQEQAMVGQACGSDLVESDVGHMVLADVSIPW